eukprot:scaffold6173_cov64-Phaeocystis_antarctica.AAC.4
MDNSHKIDKIVRFHTLHDYLILSIGPVVPSEPVRLLPPREVWPERAVGTRRWRGLRRPWPPSKRL